MPLSAEEQQLLQQLTAEASRRGLKLPSPVGSPQQLQQAVSQSATIGEMRRREEAGQVSALTPEQIQQATMSDSAKLGRAIMEEQQRLESAGAPSIFEEKVPPGAASIALGMAAPEMLAARVPALAQAAMAGRLLPRLGSQAVLGATGGAASSIPKASEMVSEGKPSEAVGEIAKETAIGGVLGPVLGEPIRGLMAGAKSVGGKLGLLKETVANIFRPVDLTPDQLKMLRSVQTIESATGQQVPISLAESINSQAISRRMGIEGAEPDPEAMSQLYELALHRAANTPRGSRTPQEISRQVFDVLDPQRQGLGKRAEMAVNDFASRAANSVNNAEQRALTVGKTFFAPGRSVASIGNDLKDLAENSLESARTSWNAAYSKAKSMPEYASTIVDLQPLIDYANSAGLNLAKTSAGNISVIAAPAGQRAAIGAAEDLLNTATLEEARNLASNLSKQIRQAGILPGVDVRTKAQLAEIAANQIDQAVSSTPALQTALGDANKNYAQNIARFRGNLSEGILKEVGEGGGLSGEAIISRLTGSNAETNLGLLTDLLGSSNKQKGLDLVKEAIVSTSSQAGRKGAGINVGDMFRKINELPENVRNQLFPNYGNLRAAFLTESRLGDIRKAVKSPEDYLMSVNADPRFVEQMLGTTDKNALQNLAQKAVQEDVRVKSELSKLGLDKLTERNSFDIAKFVSDPVNQPKIANVVSRLSSRKPDVLRDVQSLFIDDLLKNSTTKGVVDGQKLLDLISAGTPAGATTAGRVASPFFETANTLLGNSGRQELEKVARAIAEMPVPAKTASDVNRGLLNYLLVGYQGGSIAQGSPSAVLAFLSRLWNSSDEIRYRFAAKTLTSPELRKLAMTPIKDIEPSMLNVIANQVSSSIRQEFGKNSEEYKQALEAENVLP
ncbi:hypothetical protein EBT25_01725 [bacterium]|nr:hypothetical protein [bacterium]